MAKDNSFNNDSPSLREPGSNKSFVKKVRSRMSGLLPTSLSKWFGKDSDSNRATVRPRDEDDDDEEFYNIQPPTKRVKMPSPNLHGIGSNCHMNSTLTHTNTNFNINSTSNRLSSSVIADDEQDNYIRSSLSNLPDPIAGCSSRSRSGGTREDCLLNGDRDSESGESMSGHSFPARVSHQNRDVLNLEDVKRSERNSFLNSPTSFGAQSRSLFTERSISPQINSSLSSRRPSFNASTFGSPNFIDRTLITKRIINSPFYNGRTTYGGASAYDFHKGRTPITTRNQIKVKPANQSAFSSDNATLSKTARRILDALEQYDTPISNAKKIPNPLAKRPRQEGLLSKYTGANPYLMREHKTSKTPINLSSSPQATNKELQIPTVPDLLKMKLKERLQDSTVAVRQIATSSKSSLNSDEYKIKNVEDTSKYTNKMKTKVSSVRQRVENSGNEPVEEVRLPEVPLPITTLPKFDFSLPLPTSSLSSTTCSKPLVTVACSESNIKTKPVAQTEESRQEVRKTNTEGDAIEYTFSNPLVLAENLVSIIAINDFKFSDPVYKQSHSGNNNKPESVTSSKLPSATSSMFNFKPPDSTGMVLKRKNDASNSSNSDSKLVKVAPQLLTGSIDEFFAKSSPGAATPATSSVSSTPLNLLDKFKPSADTWECSTCLIRNTPDKQKCVACETPKPKSSSSSNNKTNELTITGTNKKVETNDFGKQFKLSSDKWECKECFVRNDNSATQCVACTAPNPARAKASKPLNGPSSVTIPPSSSWGDKFKPPTSTWECSTCMIRNEDETDKCIACETPKPGTKSKSDNKSGGLGPATSIFSNKKDSPEQKFKFGFFPGVQSQNETKVTTTETTPISSIFGSNNSTATTTSTPSIPMFTFGVPATLESKVEKTEKPSETKEITFKVPSVDKKSEKTDEENKTIQTTNTPTNAFAFGSTNVTTAIKPNINETHTEKKPVPAVIPPTSFTFVSNSSNNISQTVGATSQKLTAPTTSALTTASTTGGFTFTASPAPSLKRPSSNTDLHSNLEMKKGATPATLMFNLPKASQPILNKPDSTTLSKFSLISNANNKVDNNNIFGAIAPIAPTPSTTQMPKDTTNNNSSATSSFIFTPAPSVLSSAVSTGATTTTTPSTNLFTFGAPKTASTTPIMFGNPNTTITTTAESSIFKFQPTASSSNNNNNNQQQSSFGMGLQQTQPQITSNLFGSPNTSTSTASIPTSTPSATSLFGAGANKPAFETPAINPFGAAPSSSTASSTFATSTEIKPFSFGNPSGGDQLSKPSQSGFSFAQTTKSTHPEPPKAVFNFGSPAASSSPAAAAAVGGLGAAPPVAAPAAPAPGGFSFNAGANNPAPPSINFNFNPQPKLDNPSPFQSPASTNIFGGQQNPVQPIQQNGGFNFGAAASVVNNSAKTGFNFGVTAPTPQFNQPQAAASAAPSAAPAPAGMFNFGAPNPNQVAPATGGFNFNAPAAPAFNANIKPTFNFTGGATPTFSAQPSDNPSVAQRKKIRAVRRR